MSILDETSLLYRPQRGPPSYLSLSPLCMSRTGVMEKERSFEERWAGKDLFTSETWRERDAEGASESDPTPAVPQTPSKPTASVSARACPVDKRLGSTLTGETLGTTVPATARHLGETLSPKTVVQPVINGALPEVPVQDVACTPKHTPELDEQRPPKSSSGGKSVVEEVPDPDDALLPQGTRVRIIGNNRTKPRWVGLEGAIESGAPIGGWHVILLDDGRRIRVQRNAIQAIDIPSGAIFVETAPGLKLKRERSRPKVTRAQGELSPSSPTFSAVTPNAGIQRSPVTKPFHDSSMACQTESYSPAFDEQGFKTPPLPAQHYTEQSRASGEVLFDARGLEAATQLRSSPAGIGLSTDVIPSMPSPGSSHSGAQERFCSLAFTTGVTISRLNAKALRRYSKRFGLPLRSDVSRAQLVHEVQSHFTQLEVDESSAIRDFLRTLHRGGNARDQQKWGSFLTSSKRRRIEAKAQASLRDHDFAGQIH